MLRLAVVSLLWLSTPLAAIASDPINAGAYAFDGVAATDWPWWRGPDRDGIVKSAQAVPIRWSENENIVWKAAIPGRGHGSVTVVGNNVFLATANHSNETQAVLCIDRESGQQRWSTPIHQGGFTRPRATRKLHSLPPQWLVTELDCSSTFSTTIRSWPPASIWTASCFGRKKWRTLRRIKVLELRRLCTVRW